MKKFVVSVLALAMTGVTWAQNALSVADIALPQNGEATLTVSFQLDAAETYTGYSFNLELPSDLEFVMGEGTDVTYTKGACHDASHSVTANLSEGLVKVAGLSLSSKPLTSTSGELLSFTVKPKTPSLTLGTEYTGTIKDIIIVPIEGSKQNLSESTFKVTISEPVDTRTVLDELSTTAPLEVQGVNVRVRRTISANAWNTICLPFAMTEAKVMTAFGDDVEIGDFTGCEVDELTGNIKVNFSSVTAMEANHPYIIKVSSPINEFLADDVDIAPEEEPAVLQDEETTGTGRNKKTTYNSFVGTYVAETVIPDYALFISGNQFWFSTGNTRMKAFRAYFDLATAGAEYEPESARMVIAFEEETTGLDAIENRELDATEYSYDLLGRREPVQPANRVVIKNGKKVIIK